MKTWLLVLIIYTAIVTILFITTFSEKIKKDKEYKKLKTKYDCLVKYQEETSEKINDLHTGDSVSNALDILSKH